MVMCLILTGSSNIPRTFYQEVCNYLLKWQDLFMNSRSLYYNSTTDTFITLGLLVFIVQVARLRTEPTTMSFFFLQALLNISNLCVTHCMCQSSNSSSVMIFLQNLNRPEGFLLCRRGYKMGHIIFYFGVDVLVFPEWWVIKNLLE